MKHITVKYQQPAIIHAAHPVPGSMSDTLCGVMLSGHESSTASKINCPACVRIITACKDVPRDDYYKPHKLRPRPDYGCSNRGSFTGVDPCPVIVSHDAHEPESLHPKDRDYILNGSWKVPPKE